MKPRTNRISLLKLTIDEQRPGGELQRFVISTPAPLVSPVSNLLKNFLPLSYSSQISSFYTFPILGIEELTSDLLCIYICDVSYIRFSLDEAKDRANRRKHGVSFDEARTVFFDEDARLTSDPDHSSGEDRFIILGMSRKLRLLLVCHSYRRNEDIIRIISARKATRLESAQYGRQ